MSFKAKTKKSGDLALAKEWNEATAEIERLEKAKINKSGGTMTGQLTVNNNIISNGYGAKLICHRLLTAPWLNENATFGKARQHSLRLYADGDEEKDHRIETRLDFGQGNNNWEKIFSVPLTPSNLLKNNQTYVVRILVSATDITTDSDLCVGISDGNNFVGFERSDIGNPKQMGTFVSGVDGEILRSRRQVRNARTPSMTYQSFDIQMHLGKTTWISGRINSELAQMAWTSDRTIQRSNALSLAAFIQGAPEEHGIYSIEVSIIAESPIPTNQLYGLTGIEIPAYGGLGPIE
ncbi:MAG: hypothetical protein DWQ04_17190 [Chloroflexi bacterium]|nr:MAG: hypothetical protein DWQ04_17190 [Chloroflexota bacterium]